MQDYLIAASYTSRFSERKDSQTLDYYIQRRSSIILADGYARHHVHRLGLNRARPVHALHDIRSWNAILPIA